jgi:hypothetical protein
MSSFSTELKRLFPVNIYAVKIQDYRIYCLFQDQKAQSEDFVQNGKPKLFIVHTLQFRLKDTYT